MGSILQVIVLVAILGSFVLAFLSYQSMRIYNIVLVMFVFIGAMVFSYLAARTLRTHESWRTAAKARQAELLVLEQKNRELADGTEDKTQQIAAGIRQLRLELHRIAIDRGGVWYEVAPEKIKPDTGAVTVSIDAPEPHGLSEKMIVFIFDPTQYLGEFQVTKAAAKSKSVELAPNLPMNAADSKRLSNSRGPWTMYQMMPIDDASLFASMTADQRQKFLPPSLQTEFADPDRALHSYQVIFHHNSHQEALIQDDIEKININIKQTTASVAKVEEEIKYRQEEKTDLQSDLKNFQREQAAVTAYVKTLQNQLEAVRNEMRAVYTSNKQAAAELTTLQLRAADEINRRTNTQASAGPLPASGP